jgi:hypothetical protein
MIEALQHLALIPFARCHRHDNFCTVEGFMGKARQGNSRHRRRAAIAVLIATLGVGGCAPTVAGYLPDHGKAAPTEFSVCHGYGCSYRSTIRLSAEEWDAVRAKFAPRAATPAAERRQIAQAVALMELLVGLRTGTSAHQRRALLNTDPTQLDCIDEAIDTTTFVALFARDGLLAYHKVGAIAHQGTLLLFDLHNTAVVVETATGAAFAVDPNMVEATVPPPIVPLALWREKWPPPVPKDDASGGFGPS